MKGWLMDQFLPIWAKETVLRDNRALRRENHRLSARIRELESYIRGMKAVSPKIIIRGGER